VALRSSLPVLDGAGVGPPRRPLPVFARWQPRYTHPRWRALRRTSGARPRARSRAGRRRDVAAPRLAASAPPLPGVRPAVTRFLGPRVSVTPVRDRLKYGSAGCMVAPSTSWEGVFVGLCLHAAGEATPIVSTRGVWWGRACATAAAPSAAAARGVCISANNASPAQRHWVTTPTAGSSCGKERELCHRFTRG
jgi:hypothetical protein